MKTITQIVTAAASAIGTDPLNVTGREKGKMLGVLRHVAMFVAREEGYGFKEIATAFELKSHATVIYAVNRIRLIQKTDRTVRELLAKTKGALM